MKIAMIMWLLSMIDYTNVLGTVQHPLYQYQYADYLIQNGAYSAAAAVLNNVAVYCNLDEKQAAVYADYATLAQLQVGIAQSGKNLHTLYSEQKNALQGISGNANYAQSYARGALRIANGGDTLYREPMPHLPTAASERRASKKVAASSSNQMSLLRVYPNPAKDYVQVHYNASSVETTQIQVVDAKGNTISTVVVSGEGDTILPTANWVAGVYRVLLKVNEKILTECSLVIVK